jgi:hypothetical protein
MMIVLDGKKTWAEGQLQTVCSENPPPIGETVDVHLRLGTFIAGKPFAKAIVTRRWCEDPGAPLSPTKGGKKANVWKPYIEIQIQIIF